MQFCQPGYAYTRPPCTTPYILNEYPEILGEGNLASVVSPNGSMHLVFVPTSQWLRPLPCQTPQNANNANWAPTTAWIIRSVLSPVQPTFYQQPQNCFQPVQNNSHSQFIPEPYHPSSGPYELKFHNDICTSTSDILYFYPNLRTYETTCLTNLRKNPSIRLVVPPLSSNYINEATSLKSCDLEPMDTVKRMSVSPTSSSFDMSDDANNCPCRKKHKKKRKTVNKCECKAEINKRKSSVISCECKSETNKRKSNEIICKCNAATSKIKNKNINNTCECKEEADKGVATFTDQAIDCVDGKGRETQTSLHNACNTQTCKIVPLKKTKRCGSSVCTVRRCSSVYSCCGKRCCD